LGVGNNRDILPLGEAVAPDLSGSWGFVVRGYWDNTPPTPAVLRGRATSPRGGILDNFTNCLNFTHFK